MVKDANECQGGGPPGKEGQEGIGAVEPGAVHGRTPDGDVQVIGGQQKVEEGLVRDHSINTFGTAKQVLAGGPRPEPARCGTALHMSALCQINDGVAKTPTGSG